MFRIFGQNIAPEGIAAWNPAFDVTPSSLIRGIITELGVLEFDPSLGYIPIGRYLKEKGESVGPALLSRLPGAVEPSVPSTGFKFIKLILSSAFLLLKL